AAALAEIEAALTQRQDPDWPRVVAIKRNAVSAWTALAMGDTAGALRLAAEAAAMEDVTEKHPVTPGELLPARELYADLLLTIGRPADARAAYEQTLRREPGRARALYGLARASELAGDRDAARRAYQEFLTWMARSDGDRAEVAQAKRFR
ncbi:MAG: tetratricopeptide repeat protein, partial [Gemmatimonadales bacterium]|nr:tetratricopeptide repeat protein [Gemmatimonadales bacterium]